MILSCNEHLKKKKKKNYFRNVFLSFRVLFCLSGLGFSKIVETRSGIIVKKSNLFLFFC